MTCRFRCYDRVMSQAQAFLDFKAPTQRSPGISLGRVWIITSLGVSGIIFLWTTLYMGLASFAYFLMLGGLAHRRKPSVHVKFMGASMLLDLSLVLVLEFQRSAIGTAIGMKLGPLQQGHIVSSTLALVLYFPVFYLGWRSHVLAAKGVAPKRKWHVGLGILAFGLRTIGFILMFSLLQVVRSVV